MIRETAGAGVEERRKGWMDILQLLTGWNEGDPLPNAEAVRKALHFVQEHRGPELRDDMVRSCFMALESLDAMLRETANAGEEARREGWVKVSSSSRDGLVGTPRSLALS